MRILLVFALICFSTAAFSAWGKGDRVYAKINTGEKSEREYTYVDITTSPIIYDAKERQAHIGTYFKTDKDSFGQYRIILIPIKTFYFDDDKQFNKWIKSVRPDHKCLTIEGLVKCN